jgi:hypothetical protein
MISSLHSLILFLPFLLNHLGLPSPEPDPVLDKTVCCCQLRNSSLWPLCMHRAKNTTYIVKEAFVLIRCLAADVLLLLALAPAGMCLPNRCLAVGLYVTISSCVGPGVRKLGLALLFGPNWADFYLRTETETSLGNIDLKQKTAGWIMSRKSAIV